ncbi:MAG: M23 family metallopeptidase [Bdellovibrionales bacterium]|jgi:murein DD-endopeptidase MepM/ murein hydrolase activator NlpD|nr:M23 family metallopeptidase [Bdellovibrionales bacterium]MBT3525419.1 M23 family metallopeptidase [Bdellovibrionales bacterium]MBT7766258.1 M23 family metallopeptidase [Bdellovibrionales bacterium]
MFDHKLLTTFIFLVVNSIMLSSCSQLTSISVPETSLASFIPPAPKDVMVLPGEVVRFTIPYDINQEEDATLLCHQKRVPAFKSAGELVVFLSESYFTKGESYRCLLVTGELSREVALITIGKKEYLEERLSVDKKRVFLAKKDLEQVQREQKILNRVYADYQQSFLFTQAFEPPLASKITSIYGTRRIYNNKKKGQHLGTDYRAAIGTPIVAANSGEVVLARHLFFTGNTVIVSHGLSIFTVYGHLSKLFVSKGDRVLQRDLLGEAGVSGRVTGPHLHWGVKVNGNWVDGYSLIRETATDDSASN